MEGEPADVSRKTFQKLRLAADCRGRNDHVFSQLIRKFIHCAVSHAVGRFKPIDNYDFENAAHPICNTTRLPSTETKSVCKIYKKSIRLGCFI